MSATFRALWAGDVGVDGPREIRVGLRGPDGPAGPNRVTAATGTDLTGLLYGTGTFVTPVAVGSGLQLQFVLGPGGGYQLTATGAYLPLTGGTVSGVITATAFVGDGSGLTNLPASGGTPGGISTQVQFNDAGAFAGNAALTFDKTTGVTTVGGLQVKDGANARKGTVVYNDPGGMIRIGRTDHSAYVYAQVNSTFAVWSGSGVDIVFSTSAQQLVLCGREDGGSAVIDLNRRYSDSSAGVGGTVNCWTKTGQTAAAFAVLAPGGGSQLTSIHPSGAWVPATLADSAAPNNSVYYSTTQSKLVYKSAAGVVNNLY